MPCTKKKYKDGISARHALSIIKIQGKHGHNECREYLCDKCGSYHLTSSNGKMWDKRKVALDKEMNTRVKYEANYWENKLT